MCVGLTGALAANAPAEVIHFQSGSEQVSLVELYTSEGCSSCPLAENWISGFKTSPHLWKDFVPVAYHVDYWDRLGWRDPWGSKSFSDRQSAFAQFWRSDSVYTPELILNGKEWRDWPENRGGPKPSGAKPGLLAVTASDTNHWQVSFAPTSLRGLNYEVSAALLAGGLSSEVKAGENRGRRLTHDFVVLSLVKANLSQVGDLAKGEFVLPRQTNSVAGDRALAVWVTEAGRQEVLQATGGWLGQSAASR